MAQGSGFGYYSPVAGNGTYVTNGQILQGPMQGAFFPSTAQVPFYKGSGQPPPTVPINYMSGSTSGDNLANLAGSNPWSFTQSPLIIAVAALIIGLVGLRYIHWRH